MSLGPFRSANGFQTGGVRAPRLEPPALASALGIPSARTRPWLERLLRARRALRVSRPVRAMRRRLPWRASCRSAFGATADERRCQKAARASLPSGARRTKPTISPDSSATDPEPVRHDLIHLDQLCSERHAPVSGCLDLREEGAVHLVQRFAVGLRRLPDVHGPSVAHPSSAMRLSPDPSRLHGRARGGGRSGARVTLEPHWQRHQAASRPSMGRDVLTTRLLCAMAERAMPTAISGMATAGLNRFASISAAPPSISTIAATSKRKQPRHVLHEVSPPFPLRPLSPQASRAHIGETTESPSASYCSSAKIQPAESVTGGLRQRCSYVKAGLALSVLKTTRASWRLRQRIASRRLLPSARLRSR